MNRLDQYLFYSIYFFLLRLDIVRHADSMPGNHLNIFLRQQTFSTPYFMIARLVAAAVLTA